MASVMFVVMREEQISMAVVTASEIPWENKRPDRCHKGSQDRVNQCSQDKHQHEQDKMAAEGAMDSIGKPETWKERKKLSVRERCERFVRNG